MLLSSPRYDSIYKQELRLIWIIVIINTHGHIMAMKKSSHRFEIKRNAIVAYLKKCYNKNESFTRYKIVKEMEKRHIATRNTVYLFLNELIDDGAIRLSGSKSIKEGNIYIVTEKIDKYTDEVFTSLGYFIERIDTKSENKVNLPIPSVTNQMICRSVTGNVWNSLLAKRASGCKLHMTLLDPQWLKPKDIAELAYTTESLGSDAIILGGSTGITLDKLDDMIKEIKKVITIPVILFPLGSGAISKRADAAFFSSILNSRNLRFLIGELSVSSVVYHALGIETISMGYLIIEPGMKVGEVCEAELIKKDEYHKLIGLKMIYLEAGSGANRHVPAEMVIAVKKVIDIPVAVGGGIRYPSDAYELSKAGADIIVTGMLSGEDQTPLKHIIQSFKSV